MTDQRGSDITGLLTAWNDGESGALNRLMDLLYPELKRIARRQLGQQGVAQTLESGALANEAYLKLVRARGIRSENRAHFLAVCAQIIRRILVDRARTRGFAKRGGNALRVPLDEALLAAEERGVEILALDRALEKPASIDHRKSRVVELRYFSGLTIEETAEVLGVSIDTAKRDWRMSKAWLMAELEGQRSNAT
jgi:RNA polymerase sigma-70 factor, ECF subfamily